jgi:hypothetical protein
MTCLIAASNLVRAEEAADQDGITYYCSGDCTKPIELWTACDWVSAAKQQARACELSWGFVDSMFSICDKERNTLAVVRAQKEQQCSEMAPQ